MKGGNLPSKTVLYLFSISPTAVLTGDFGVDPFLCGSMAFGLTAGTIDKRDLYLIVIVRYG